MRHIGRYVQIAVVYAPSPSQNAFVITHTSTVRLARPLYHMENGKLILDDVLDAIQILSEMICELFQLFNFIHIPFALMISDVPHPA